MSKKTWAIILAALGVSQWFFPQFNGMFFDSSNVSLGEGRIVASVFFVGALILWFWKADNGKSDEE